MTDVRYGSFASILAYPHDVRFTPNSDRRADVPDWALSAIRCHMHRSKGRRYSITSSALASSVCGTVSPRVLAVLRLTARLNLVGF